MMANITGSPKTVNAHPPNILTVKLHPTVLHINLLILNIKGTQPAQHTEVIVTRPCHQKCRLDVYSYNNGKNIKGIAGQGVLETTVSSHNNSGSFHKSAEKVLRYL